MEAYKLAVIYDFGGNIEKRWFVQYYYLNPDTNRFKAFRVHISSKIKNDTARHIEANKIQETINEKLIKGFNPFTEKHNTKPGTLIAALERIFEVKKITCGKRAQHTYGYLIRKLTGWLIENKIKEMKPAGFTKEIAMNYFDYLLTKEKVSNRTYNNHLIGLRTLFNGLFERDYIYTNTLCKLKKLREREAAIYTYTEDEKETIRKNLPMVHKELYLASLFVYYSFIRPAELVRLQFKDIHSDKGIIRVPSYKSKNGRTQTVIMPTFLRELYIEMGYHKLPSEMYVFSNNFKLTPGNTLIAPTRIAGAWRTFVQDRLGIKKGIYLLKHTGVGQLFEAGADARNIQLQMRHASLDETQIYLSKFANAPNTRINSFYDGFQNKAST
ncbi:MAG TPA: site-specific integrase [Bacteroidia bacterium]